MAHELFKRTNLFDTIVMKKYSNRLIFLFFIVLAAEITIAQSSKRQENPSFEEVIKSRVAQRKVAIKKYIPKILALQKEINENSSLFMFPIRTGQDAGPYLNQRLDWVDVVNDANSKKAFEKYLASLGSTKITKISIPAGVIEKVNEFGSDYIKKAAEIDLKSVDFSWFNEIKKYDMWDIEENSPLAHMDEFDFTKYPIPKFIALYDWSKLRLIKGVQEKNMKTAFDEVVHLARLLHSTETLIGAISSNAIFKLASQFAKIQGIPFKFKVDTVFTDKAKLYFLSLGKAVGTLMLDPHVFNQLTQVSSGPGFCAAIYESGAGILMLRPLLGNELKEYFLKYESILKSPSNCRWRHVRKAWAGDPKYVSQLKAVATAPIEVRKQFNEEFKKHFPNDYPSLKVEVANSRWPQYVGYLFATVGTPEQMFENLGVK